jgi:prophage maintenance system killer protein
MATITYDEAVAIATEIGAQPNHQALAGVLGNIEQTFEGAPLYPTVEERAAHLLYFLVKGHAFKDGTKRGAVAVFEEYLRKNERPIPGPQILGQILQRMFSDGASQDELVAMTLRAMAEASPTA